MVDGSIAFNERLTLETAHTLLSNQILITTPRLRESLSTSLYDEFAYVMFAEKAHEKLLWKIGTFRRRAHEIQIWVADDPMENPVMITLLDLARRFQEIAAAGNVQIVMDGKIPLVIKLKGAKKEDVKRLIHKHWGVQFGRLLHLGRHLKNGMLEEQDIYPGACLMVS